ncbi:hypothetical protein BASA81_017931 [Batrachochytrium salamandrivorans]|nr:hypothetical protein BASA81_017931 [Batrachochytrium salamandrivorans]
MAASAAANDEAAAVVYDALPLPEHEVIHRLVYDYLIHNCYSSTAHSFGMACSLSEDLPLSAESKSEVVDNNSITTGTTTGIAGRQQETETTDTPSCYIEPHSPVSRPGVDHDGDMDMTESSSPRANQASAKPYAAHSSAAMMDSDSFKKSVGSLFQGPLKTLETRRCLHRLILSGQLAEAIALCNSAFPGMLNDQVPEATDVLFALQCQQFIECVRRSAPEALCFAQQELGKFAFKSTKYSETLRDIVALIAYTNPETSPLSTYMSQSRNEHVAMSLNSYILSYHGSPSRTALERLAAHATVLREQLHADLGKDKKSTNSSAVKSRSDAFSYPRWQFSSFVPQ